jgi:predicted DNA-binding transcriptional regulator AlpA
VPHDDPRPTSPEKKLWKVADVGTFLCLTPKAIYALVESGALPCVRIGSRLRFIPSVVAAWVEAQSASRSAGAPRRCGSSTPAELKNHV